MDTPERPDGALSPWTPSTPAVQPSTMGGWEDPAREAAGPPRMFSPKLVVRALRRHWWQILAVWMVGSLGLMYLAYTKIKPMYDAVSWILVEPASSKVLANMGGGSTDFGPYLDTQVLLVTSPEVLQVALDDPEVKQIPRITMAEDPETDLRKEIGVGIPQRGTHLIQVRMTGEKPEELVKIVNAVVRAYIDKAELAAQAASNNQIKAMKKTEDNYSLIIEDLKKTIRELTRKNADKVQKLANQVGDIEPKDPVIRDPKDALGRWEMTMEQFRGLQVELIKLQIERHQAETTVKFLDDDLRARGGGGTAVAAGPMSDEEIEAQVHEMFIDLHEAQRLDDVEADMTARYDQAVQRIRNLLDPTVKRAKKNMEDAKADHDNYWKLMRPKLRRQVLVAAAGGSATDPALASREVALTNARLDLERLRTSEKLLEQRIDKASVEVKTANSEIIDIKFAEQGLAEAQANLALIQKSREQLLIDARQTRVSLEALARSPRAPSSNNRLKAMVAAPVLVLLISCLAFVALEFKGGRVSDPDEFSQRTRVGVIGVVPPLPSLGNRSGRALSARGQRDERRRVEEFVQSLDHLRVTLCAQRPGMATDRRCVLITSATGGEGKTTLAAQLAGRCANAGLMTLLIDADLRRPSLGDLLEVPEGPGLVDVLNGDATPEAAMVVIGNAGGFHLLPAGTMGQDPSRLLHGDRIGKLIAQFRETFDMVIIDAPPVLAVPDALLLGRWTDGAVLAVRHDSSRFPLVERANRRLGSVGVAVLGAVVNGCRTMESAYGSYRYTPYAAADAPGGESEV